MDAVKGNLGKLKKFDSLKGLSKSSLASGDFKNVERRLSSYRKQIATEENKKTNIEKNIIEIKSEIDLIKQNPDAVSNNFQLNALEAELSENLNRLKNIESRIESLTAEAEKTDLDLKGAKDTAKNFVKDQAKSALVKFAIANWIPITIAIIVLIIVVIIFSAIQRVQDNPGEAIDTVLRTRCLGDISCVGDYINTITEDSFSERL